MHNSLRRRVLTLVVALLAGLTGPGAALAHCVAHAGEATVTEHAHGSGAPEHGAAKVLAAAEISGLGCGAAHPTIEVAPTARHDANPCVAPVPPSARWAEPPAALVRVHPSVVHLPDSGPPGSPLPRLRAPPSI